MPPFRPPARGLQWSLAVPEPPPLYGAPAARTATFSGGPRAPGSAMAWAGTLRVTVLQARHLAGEAREVSPYAAVVVDCPYQRHKSAAVANSLNPEWTEQIFSLCGGLVLCCCAGV